MALRFIIQSLTYTHQIAIMIKTMNMFLLNVTMNVEKKRCKIILKMKVEIHLKMNG